MPKRRPAVSPRPKPDTSTRSASGTAPRRAALPDAEALGRVLRDFREAAGLTQEKLGFAAHVTKNYVSDVEGARRNPTIRVVTQILDALGVGWEECGAAYDRARR